MRRNLYLLQVVGQQGPHDQLHGREQAWHAPLPPLCLQVIQHQHHRLPRPHATLDGAGGEMPLSAQSPDGEMGSRRLGRTAPPGTSCQQRSPNQSITDRENYYATPMRNDTGQCSTSVLPESLIFCSPACLLKYYFIGN